MSNDRINLGLERILSLVQHLVPTPSALFEIPSIHLAGTNGKGSVSAFLEASLLASGLKVGRYNSPHLLTINDSIRINGKAISRQDYDAARAVVEETDGTHNIGASLFELTTATALLLFKQASPPLDLVILECGMGGQRDATNILDPAHNLVCALTQVDLDHQAFLGGSVEEIAKEKAGIVGQGGILVLGRQTWLGVESVVQATTAKQAATLIHAATTRILPGADNESSFALKPFRPPPMPTVLVSIQSGEIETSLPLPGPHQVDNLALAVTILDTLRTNEQCTAIVPSLRDLSDEHIKTGIASTRWPGRCSWLQTTEGPILVDGAHNTAASTLLRQYIDSLGLDGPVTFIISLSHSPPKTPESVLEPLIKAGDRVALVEFSTPVEGMPWVKPVAASDIANAIGHVAEVWAPESGRGLTDALRWANEQQGLVVLCGSLYLVADLYRHLGKNAI
jgi:folylpolyglutamate synthase/dihydrofolate synthase